MIKISLPNYNERLELESPFSLLISIENKKSLVKIMMDLNSERIEEVIGFYDLERAEFWEKEKVRFIESALFVDPNDKKNLTMLRKQLKKCYTSQLNDSAVKLKSKLEKWFEDIRLDFDIDLISDIELKAEDLLKMMNIKINASGGTLLERILCYRKVSMELTGTKVFLFHHLSLFLEKEELTDLVHESALLGCSVVDFESDALFAKVLEKSIVLDSDFTAIL